MPIFGFILLLAFCLILFGIGVVIAAVTVAAVAGLLALGVISSSFMIGVTRKDPSTGVKVFILQATALLGAAGGAGLAFLAKLFFEFRLTLAQSLSLGTVSGLLAGLAVGIVVNLAWPRLIRYLRARMTAT